MTSQQSSPRIADLVHAAADRMPEAPALIVTADRIPISYRDLIRLVEDLAGQLTDAGLRPGDRIGLRTASSAEFVVALLAASRADLVAVPLDPALPVADQRARTDAAGARAVLIDGVASGDETEPDVVWWPIAVSVNRAEGTLSVHLDAAGQPKPATSSPQGLHHDDAMIMFTGGTTGLPKMVPWTRGNLANSVRSIIAGYQLGPQDATVAVMPLYHGHGLVAALLSSLASGGTVLLPAGGRFSAHTFWDDIAAAGATWYTAVPTIHQILLERAKTESASQPAALRFIRSCSAPLTAEVVQGLQAAFSAPVVSAFGMTEATHQVSTTGVDEVGKLSEAAGLVGNSTGAEIRIAGPDGAALPPGAVGEVWLHGSTVVRGYLGDPKITAANFTDGWLRTGDLGSLSEQGALSIRGRIKELINRGGEKISPERVEGILASHPNVLEAAVFGVPHPMYGEAVAAAIVPRGANPPSSEDLTEFCRERLAGYEIPATFEVTSELPHTAKGSLDRRAVAQRFGRQG
ncbi:FadD7 family fatty acid--CoA ligase [Mycobacterium kubicae]|uniref:FadD7 family fatty acid--CoA ligase n=1 Tax=Mycobacterium kubicae TaxID=120959 RepID=UPI0007FFEA81|nr:FadD7 family fatty acid--CoA ligase [Mycobacterium kubicae]OBK46642.1 acyl-CoA synthetase [Mycobacterium kubicae]